jgi:CheY-like chemotaxis protein
MVYGFAKQSNGHIVIESAHGKGTKISLFLPAAAPPAEALVERPKPGATVLVVEDDPLVRAALATQIDRLGHRAMTSAGAPDALQFLARSQPVDVLFIGAVRGAFSGRQLADEAIKLRPDLRVQLSWPERHDPAQAGCCGDSALTLIGTPYRAADLATTLRSALAA